MKPKRVSFTPVTGATNNIAVSQAVAGAVPLVLAGALAVGGVLPPQALGYIISFTSISSDESGKTFLITGTSADDKAQTETVTGPGAGLTVVSTKFFKSISSIVASGALTANISVGTPNTTLCAVTPTYCVDMGAEYTTLAADIGGTINFTLQKCYERPTAGETPNWITAQAAGAVDVQTLITGPVGAVRAQINTYTNTATFAMSILQAD